MNEIDTIESAPQRAVSVSPTPGDLLRIAVESGADIDKLERLMALQERWEAAQAKRAYDEAFAAFKAEAVTVIKNRTVTEGPLKNKRYAELFAVVNAVTPALSKHGLSSSWKLTKDDKDWIEVTCYLKHVGGHVESVSMGGPPDTGGAKNAIQARASTVTYLERYTMKAITGLSEQEDDTDGNATPADPEAAARKQAEEDHAQSVVADWRISLQEATNREELSDVRMRMQKANEAGKIPAKAAEVLRGLLAKRLREIVPAPTGERA